MYEYDLTRFLDAQEKTYNQALQEIKNGYKETHWIWFIFPQLLGLGESYAATYYGIKNLEEAEMYLDNDILRNRLIEITEALLNVNGLTIEQIVGYPDNLKIQSCMTLFNAVDPSFEVFKEVLDKYYDGLEDEATIRMLTPSLNKTTMI